jgi:hypothetical protein
MSPCFFVTHERVDALADRLHGGLIENGLAELTGLLHYGRFFEGRLHNQWFLTAARAGLPMSTLGASIHHIRLINANLVVGRNVPLEQG